MAKSGKANGGKGNGGKGNGSRRNGPNSANGKRNARTSAKTEEAVRRQPAYAESPLPIAYANQVSVTHTQREFVLDFILRIRDDPLQLASRVVTSPAQAKATAQALSVHVRQYEREFGAIERKADERKPRLNGTEMTLLAVLVAENKSLPLTNFTGKRFTDAKRTLLEKKLVVRRGRRYHIAPTGFHAFREHVEQLAAEIGV